VGVQGCDPVPIEYEIDQSRRLIRTTCRGEVRFPDVMAHFRMLREHTSLPENPDVLLDFSELETFPDSEHLRSVALEVGSLMPEIQWRNCALVAPADLAFGIGRMFEMATESYFRAVMVFRKREEAEAWLEKGR
jgi:hypothetical protein